MQMSVVLEVGWERKSDFRFMESYFFLPTHFL